MNPIKFFYLFVAVDALTSTTSLLNALAVHPSPLSGLPDTLAFLEGNSVVLMAIALLLLNLLVPFSCFLFSSLPSLRIMNFMVFFLSKGLIFSAYRFAHVYWPMLWILLFFAIPKRLDNDLDNDRLALFSYRAAILAAASFYFLAGFWKVTSALTSGDLWRGDYAANTIAYYLLTHGKKSLVGDFMIQNPMVAYIGFGLVTVLQLSSILPLFSRRYLRIWPLLILGFHWVSLLVVQVNFMLAGIACALIMLFAPPQVVISPAALWRRWASRTGLKI